VPTLLLTSTNPLGAAGPGTFLDKMLTFAGGRNVLDASAGDYPQLSKETVVTLDPDVIVIVRGQAGDPPDELPASLAELQMRAVQEGNVRWLSDPHAMLPTTTMPRVTAKLAKVLHPDLADRIDRIFESDESK